MTGVQTCALPIWHDAAVEAVFAQLDALVDVAAEVIAVFFTLRHAPACKLAAVTLAVGVLEAVSVHGEDAAVVGRDLARQSPFRAIGRGHFQPQKLRVPAFAANDPIAVVNNLSDFIFGLIRAVGLILLGWGIVQVGLSFQSHDPSQRSNGFLTLAGGIVITFAKEILNLITG